MTTFSASEYINQQRRDYALYTMTQRAIPNVTDGLKAGSRRVLWVARDGKHYKSATLAGATMPLHPHASPEGAIDTLAGPYGNNIPLFKADGAFGTLMEPTAYGASRYTAVETSTFTNDVVFRDIEIVPMKENYDGTTEEPIHFLPLIPVVLLNPSSGAAIGFASRILPRALDDLINVQIGHLKGSKKLVEPLPKFIPLDTETVAKEAQYNGNIAYYFDGKLERKDASTATITMIPYSATHAETIAKLDKMVEGGNLLEYTDNSKNVIDIKLKFKRGYLNTIEDKPLMKLLGLSVRDIENLNVLDFTGQVVWSPTPLELIVAYTDWRLTWYLKRYERLRDLLKIDIQRYYDIRIAIKNNIGAVARKTQSRAELKEFLEQIKIVSVDYIADLPVYRFTEDERLKNEQRIIEAEAQMKEYVELISSEDKRKQVYLTELQEVLTKYNKGTYTK